MRFKNQLKKIFADNAMGSEKDWKRVEQKKNANQQIVRVFENRKSGEKVEVTETAEGQYIIGKSAQAVFSVQVAPLAKKTLADFLETNEEKKKAAAILLAEFYDDDRIDDDYIKSPREGKKRQERLLAEAGSRAVNNLYCFAVLRERGEKELTIVTSPIYDLDDTGCKYGLEQLPDSFYATMESIYECREGMTIREIVATLLEAGLQWSEMLQRCCEREAEKPLFKEVKKAVDIFIPKHSSPPKPKM